MATKKRTKASKKASSSTRRGGKKSRAKTTSKKARKKPRQTVTPPYTGLSKAPYGWGRLSASARKVASQRWKRRPASAAKGTVLALPAATADTPASHALVQAYARAGGTPPGYVRSGPHVGPARPWPTAPKKTSSKKAASKKAASKKTSKKTTSKKRPASKKARARAPSKAEFLERMAAGRAAAAAKKAAKKKRSKVAKKAVAKTASKKTHSKKAHSKKAHAKKAHSKKRAARGGRPAQSDFAAKMAAARAAKASKRSARKNASAAPRTKTSGKRRPLRKGWPKAGARKRTFGIAKFKAMHALGVPPNHPVSKAKRTMLREAAGRGISAKEIFDMASATNMKAWVCAGRVRTGCGGGSKMLRGSHQIGVFGAGRR